MEETSNNDSLQRNNLNNKIMIVSQRNNESFDNLNHIDSNVEEYEKTITK